MKEIGGYIELDTYRGDMLHDGAMALNCGRNCLAYLIKAKKIRKIVLPYFLCDSVRNLCDKEGVEIRYYHIDKHFLPTEVELLEDEWLYIVNFYGQVSREKITFFKNKYQSIIIDNAQDYFQQPVESVDTLYTCRKFLGVADGAFLYTDTPSEENLPVDESFERMQFLLGRFERTASEFYGEYAANNKIFANEPIKAMSKLTKNLLHAVDYEYIKKRRTENFNLYYEALRKINRLEINHAEGAFAYPLLLENGAEVRAELQKKKIYIPTLWPNVMKDIGEYSPEYNLAQNILPLPCDQRYDKKTICYVINEVEKCINK